MGFRIAIGRARSGVFLLLCSCLSWGYSQEDPAYTIFSWNTKTGLPQNSVNDILQDRDGSIWMATFGGLVRFDGNTFHHYDTKLDSGIFTNRFTHLYINDENELFALSNEGYLIYRDKNKVFHSIPYPADHYYSTHAVLDPAGYPIVYLGSLLYRYRPTTGFVPLAIENPELLPKELLQMIWDKPNDRLLINSVDGVYTLKEERVQIIEASRGNYISASLQFGDTLILTSGDQLIVLIEDREVQRIPVPTERGLIPRLLRDHEGNVWKTSEQGLIQITPNPPGSPLPFSPGRKLTVDQGLSSNLITSIWEDREQNLWVGTKNNGINKLSLNLFRIISKKEGLTESIVNPVLQDASGDLWVGNNCGGLNQIRDNRVINRYKSLSFLDEDIETYTGDCIASLEQDADGNLWVGFYSNGITVLKQDGSWENFFQDSSGMRAVIALERLDNNDLFVGTLNGGSIYQWETRSFVSAKDSLNLPVLRIQQVFQDSKGTLWLGSPDGMWNVSSDTLRSFTMDNGLPNNNVRSFHEDDEGRIWAGTYGGGLVCVQGDSLITINTTHGLYDDIVSVILEKDGVFWFTCNRGLYGVYKKELIDFVEGRTSRVHSLYFDTDSGLRSNEFNGGIQPAGFISGSGELVLPTLDGVVFFDPNRIPKLSAPWVLFDYWMADGERIPVSGHLELPSNTKRISLHLGIPAFTYPENIVKEYKLEGFDDSWQVIGSNQTLEFTNLAPGEYTLTVRVRSLLDPTGTSEEAQADFSIRAPWWRQSGFIIFSTALILTVSLVTTILVKLNSVKRQREFERKLADHTAELERSRMNLQTVLENNDDLIWAVDRSFHLISANEKFLDAFEARNGHRLQPGESIMERTREGMAHYWRPYFERALRGERIKIEVNRTGSDLIFETSEVAFYPTRNEEGEITGIVGFTKDISDIREREKELRNAKEQAELAAQSKADFLATMSHEIRTPMNGVIGMTSLLLNTKLTPEQRDFVNTIRISGDTLMTIINEILDFSKAESGQMELEIQPFDLRLGVYETLDLLRAKAQEKGLKLGVHIDPNIPRFVEGDVTRLRQILLNLVSNAIKFTHEGTVNVFVYLLTQHDEHVKLKFAIKDTGIGIRKEKMDELFEPFKQLDSSTTRKYGGTGLGLAISKKLVEAMQGDIWAESEYGTGSRFYFTVHLRHSEQASEETEETLKQPIALQKVVVVDGPQPSSVNVTNVLKSWGAKQVTILNPESWKTHTPDADTGLIVLQLGDRTWEADQFIREQKSKREQIPTLLILEHPPTLNTSEHVHYVISSPEQPLLPDVFYEKISELQENHQRVLEATKLPQKLADTYKLDILVVEDNLVNQKLATMILERLGYRADVAANGIEALEAVNRQPYDLILMDIQMPELDGFGATERIRELLPPDKQPVVVAMTANAMAGDREKCLEAGMDDYVPKPINVMVVREIIIRWGTKINEQKKVDSLL